MTCDLCGRAGLVVLEQDAVRDHRSRRKHQYGTLCVCERCLAAWRKKLQRESVTANGLRG